MRSSCICVFHMSLYKDKKIYFCTRPHTRSPYITGIHEITLNVKKKQNIFKYQVRHPIVKAIVNVLPTALKQYITLDWTIHCFKVLGSYGN